MVVLLWIPAHLDSDFRRNDEVSSLGIKGEGLAFLLWIPARMDSDSRRNDGNCCAGIPFAPLRSAKGEDSPPLSASFFDAGVSSCQSTQVV